MHYIIIRPGAIGDNLLAFPILQALRMQDEATHITFVGNAAVLPLALEAQVAEVVSDYNSLQWSELFSTRGIYSSTLQALLQSIDNAICWLRDPEQIIEQNLRSLDIQQIIIAPGRPSPDEHIHILDYLAHTLNLPLPIAFSPLLPPCTDASVSYEPARSHHHHIVLAGSTHAHQQIAIHPGSGGAQKCWSTAHFASLINALWQINIPILLLAGPADSTRLTELLSQLPPPPSPLLLTTLINAPLLTIAQQLQHCRGYIGNDSGITHLAALLAIPTIAIFGPSDPLVWRPHGNTTRVLYEPTLANLRTDTVLSTIEDFFSMHV